MSETQTEKGTIFKLLEPVLGGYSFCWEIEYLSGVIKRGGWNCDANHPSMQAWRQPGENILRCAVIAMSRHERAKHRAAECSGQEFFGFEWVYTGRLFSFGAVQSRIHGLCLLTETERVTIYENGQAKVSPFNGSLINKYPQGRTT